MIKTHLMGRSCPPGWSAARRACTGQASPRNPTGNPTGSPTGPPEASYAPPKAAIHAKLANLGVTMELNRGLASIEKGGVKTLCAYTGSERDLAADAVVLVASRLANDSVWEALKMRRDGWADAGITSIKVIGDAQAPGPIAWATYAGHRYARELNGPDIGDALPFKREVTELAAL